MSHQMITSDLYLALSDKQQEVVTGGTDFELASSNFAKRIAHLQGLAASGPNGSVANSTGISATVNTAAQDFLGLGTPSLPTVGALGSAPSLNGSGDVPSVPTPEAGSQGGS
ncbi:CTB family bacteriocin [Nostoc sp. CHAB 5844]|nr:CTB family bacteriocin [Nostoc sp. CHAB 5844]